MCVISNLCYIVASMHKYVQRVFDIYSGASDIAIRNIGNGGF